MSAPAAPQPAIPAVVWAANPERIEAIEVDRTVPANGNMWIGKQQIWFGPAHGGRPVTLWIDTSRMHVLINGQRWKTLPSRRSGRDLRALLATGKARPAGYEPVPGGSGLTPGAVELERMVNRVGLIGLGGARHNVGWNLAGRRVRLRLDGTVMHVPGDRRELPATLPCPVAATGFARLQGAHPAGPAPHAPGAAPRVAERIVSGTGSFIVARQLVKAGKQHARAVVQVGMDEVSIQVFHTGTLIATMPRTTDKNIKTRASGEYRRRTSEAS